MKVPNKRTIWAKLTKNQKIKIFEKKCGKNVVFGNFWHFCKILENMQMLADFHDFQDLWLKLSSKKIVSQMLFGTSNYGSLEYSKIEKRWLKGFFCISFEFFQIWAMI